MKFNLTYGPDIASAPAGFKATVEAVAAFATMAPDQTSINPASSTEASLFLITSAPRR